MTETTKKERRFPIPPGLAPVYTEDYWTFLHLVREHDQKAGVIQCTQHTTECYGKAGDDPRLGLGVKTQERTTGFVWPTKDGDWQAVAVGGVYALFQDFATATTFVADQYAKQQAARREREVGKELYSCVPNPKHVGRTRDQIKREDEASRQTPRGVIIPRRGYYQSGGPMDGWSTYARLAPYSTDINRCWMLRDIFIPVADMSDEHCFNVLLFLETDRARGSEAKDHYGMVMTEATQGALRYKALRHALRAHKETK